MFGQSVFGGTPLGISFEAGIDTGGAHASASGGSSSGPGGSLWPPPGCKIVSGQLVCASGGGGASAEVPIPPGCKIDIATGKLLCPTTAAPPLSPAYRLNPALLFPKPAPMPMPRQASFTPPAALGAKPFPWMWVGLGMIVLGGAGYWWYSKQAKKTA